MKKLLFKVLTKVERVKYNSLDMPIKTKVLVGTYSYWEYPKVGTWTKLIERFNLNLCTRGYHLSKREHLWNWIEQDYYLFVAEGRVAYKYNSKLSNKRLYGQVRLIKCLGKIKSNAQYMKIQRAKTDTSVLRCFPKKKKGK
jgi:hypothetical protein